MELLFFLCVFIFVSATRGALRDGVTEFYGPEYAPVHMIVSGNVLVSDEPQIRTLRSKIPHAPSFRNKIPYVPLVDSDGVSYIYNGRNINHARYFVADLTQKRHQKKHIRHKKLRKTKFQKKRKHRSQQVKQLISNRKHLVHRKKEVKGMVRDEIPEKHVIATRKTLYPPPSNMWVINQELTDTEESLRNNGKLRDIEQTVLDNPANEQDYIIANGQISEYPHPEVESTDASTNFRTKEKVPKLVQRIEKHHQENILERIPSYSPMTKDSNDQEIETMFNKGKHREVFGTETQALRDSNEYHAKIHELQSRIKDLTENADDNKVEEVHITHGGTHTVNGKVQKPGNNVAPDSDLKQNFAKADSEDKQNTQEKEPYNIIAPDKTDEKEYANSFEERFLKLYSPQRSEDPNNADLAQAPAEVPNKKKEPESINGESSVKQGGYLLHGEETESKFKPHVKTLVIQTDKVNLDDATANGIPIEQPKSDNAGKMLEQAIASDEEVENPAGYTPSVVNFSSKLQEDKSTKYAPQSVTKMSPQSNVNIAPQSNGNISPPSSGNISPQSGTDTYPQPSTNMASQSDGLPEKKPDHAVIQQSFKDLLTKKIKENLAKINPNGASIKAEKLTQEAINTPHLNAAALKNINHPVVYPSPTFNEFKLHKDDEKAEKSSDESDNPIASNHKQKDDDNSMVSNEMQQNIKSDMQEALEPDDKIDSKTEKPVTARNDPDENQMTITADPSNDESNHALSPKNTGKTELLDQSDKADPQYDGISSENLLDKPRAVQYLIHKHALKHKPGVSFSNSNIDTTTSQSSIASNYKTPSTNNADQVTFQSASLPQSTTASIDQKPSTSINVANSRTPESYGSTQSTTDDSSLNYLPNADQITNQATTEQTQDQQNSAAIPIDHNVQYMTSMESQPQDEQSITASDTTANLQQTNTLENQPVDVAIKNNVNEPSTSINEVTTSVPEVTISTPEDITMNPNAYDTTDVAKLITTPTSQGDSVAQGNIESEHKEVNSVVTGSKSIPYDTESKLLSKTVKVNAPSMFEAIAWPSGVNPGALYSSEIHPEKEITPGKVNQRENIHFTATTQDDSEVNTQENVAAINQPEPYEKHLESLKHFNQLSHNFISLLKPQRPTGPSIAFNEIIPAIPRGVYTSSKSKAKVQVSSNAASSSSSNSNTAEDDKGKAESSTETGANTRHHEQKPSYGYGSGSGYGFGTKSYGWGGGGGWSGSAPPKGMPVSYPANPPPNIPGFPDTGTNSAPPASTSAAASTPPAASAPAASSSPPAASAPAAPPASPASAPAASSSPPAASAPAVPPAAPASAPAAPPQPSYAGASQTPQGNNSPQLNQNHQSSDAVGPNSVPPSYTGAKTPLPIKHAGKLKEKYNNGKYPKVDKIKVTNVKILHEKIGKMKNLQLQNKYEQYKPVQPNQQVEPSSQGNRIPKMNYVPKTVERMKYKNLKELRSLGPKSNFPDDD